MFNRWKRRHLKRRFNLFQLQLVAVSLFTTGFVVGSYFLLSEFFINNISAATSPWTQSDWSGGLNVGTVTTSVNTYESISNLEINGSNQLLISPAYKTATLKGSQLSDNTTNVNTSSSKALKFNTSQDYNDNAFSYSAGAPTRLTVNEGGDYLVSLTMPLVSSYTTTSYRTSVQAEIRVNGVKKDLGLGRSGYIRNDSNNDEASNHIAVLVEDLSASDYIEIFVIGTAGFQNTNTSNFTLYAEKVEDSEAVFSATGTRVISSTDFNNTTASSLQWTSSRKDSGYTHSNSSNSHQITLDDTADYLVTVNVPLGSTAQRPNIKGKVLLDGSLIDGGVFQQGYIRSYDGHNESSIHYSGVVSTTGASQILSITLEREANSGTVTVDGEKATVFIYKLPSSDIMVSEATQVGNSSDDWNPATESNINWSNDEIIDGSVFTHDEVTDNDEIIVADDGDYLLSINAALTGGSARANPKLTVQVNGSDVIGAVSASGYRRQDSGHDRSSNQMLIPLLGLTSGDIITVSVEREAASGTVNAETPSTIMLWKKSYADEGTLVSNILDAEWPANWNTVTFSSSGTGTVVFKARSDSNSDMSTATDWASCSAITSGSTLSDNACVTNTDQYFQYQVTLQQSAGQTPIFEDVSIAFVPSDQVRPVTNASSINLVGISEGDWTNQAAALNWTAGADDGGGIGLAGYCIALDEADPGSSNSLDPETTAGSLLNALDDGIENSSTCGYIVSGNSVDLNSISGLSLTSGKQYYFSIKAVDLAGNVYTGASGTWQDLASFRFDDTTPSNPEYFSLPGDFIATKSATLVWPSSGGGVASDDDSGVAGLQYRIGSEGTWYGDNHNGNEDLTDLLANDGSYTTEVIPDYANIQEGSNIIYLRTLDNAGNVSYAYLSGALKVNTSAPSTPINLSVTPDTNTDNSFAFTWDAPDTYTGQEGNITYCYTINTLPSVSTCNYTTGGITSLSADAYANQPGENTFYVAARDEALNINYDTYESVNFTANTSAPGIPENIDIADVSVKATSSWKLAVSWEEPTSVGAGVASYEVYHSTDGVSYSIESSGTGISLVDTGLTQVTHYYKARACDSANNCGAFTNAVSLLPDGKFLVPAELTSSPVVSSITTKKATITWSTDRTSDSKVSFGTSSGSYFDEEPSKSTQETGHSIVLTNLSPGTTYYYKTKWTDEDGNTGISDEATFQTDPAPSISTVETSDIGLTSAFISFTVSGATKATINYGLTSAYGGNSEITTSPVESTYTVKLTGLLDGTDYHYKLTLEDSEGELYEFEDHEFSTLPRPKISLVRLQQVRGTSTSTVLVTWNTNTEVSSIVSYYPSSNPALVLDTVDTKLKTKHTSIIKNLLPNTAYTLIVKGRDKVGNEAVSDAQAFTTATDTRPPAISNLKVEGEIEGVGEEASAHLVVSWDTDELSSSQVTFGEGSTGPTNNRTQLDTTLTFNHVVIVPNLAPSKVYHVRAISADKENNESESIEAVVITPKSTRSALDLVISNLSKAFGFLGNISGGNQ